MACSAAVQLSHCGRLCTAQHFSVVDGGCAGQTGLMRVQRNSQQHAGQVSRTGFHRLVPAVQGTISGAEAGHSRRAKFATSITPVKSVTAFRRCSTISPKRSCGTPIASFLLVRFPNAGHTWPASKNLMMRVQRNSQQHAGQVGDCVPAVQHNFPEAVIHAERGTSIPFRSFAALASDVSHAGWFQRVGATL